MAQQAGQRLSRRRKALEEVGAGTACAMTNANTQARLCSWGTAHSSPGAFQLWKCSGNVSICRNKVSWCRALSSVLGSSFWILYSEFWVLFCVLSSLLWLSSFVVLLSCSLLARGSPEQPWNSSCSREVLPGISQLGFKPLCDAFLPLWDFLG